MTNNDLVQKLWNLCDVLREDGINYSDYVTELVMLLFIKMVHENTEGYWYQKLYAELQQNDLAPFVVKWEFTHWQGIDGGGYILEGG